MLRSVAAHVGMDLARTSRALCRLCRMQARAGHMFDAFNLTQPSRHPSFAGALNAFEQVLGLRKQLLMMSNMILMRADVWKMTSSSAWATGREGGSRMKAIVGTSRMKARACRSRMQASVGRTTMKDHHGAEHRSGDPCNMHANVSACNANSDFL